MRYTPFLLTISLPLLSLVSEVLAETKPEAIACRTNSRPIECSAQCAPDETKNETKNETKPRKGPKTCSCSPKCPDDKGDIKL